jgi:hypothetical protein
MASPRCRQGVSRCVPKVSPGYLQIPFGKDSLRDWVPKVPPGRLQTPFGKDSLRDGVPKVSPGYLQIPFGKDSLRHGVPKVSLGRLQTSFGKDSLRDGGPKVPPGCLQTLFLIKLVPILCYDYAGCLQFVWAAAWGSKCLGPARQRLQTPFGKDSLRDGVPKVPPGCLQTPFGKDSPRDGIGVSRPHCNWSTLSLDDGILNLYYAGYYAGSRF